MIMAIMVAQMIMANMVMAYIDMAHMIVACIVWESVLRVRWACLESPCRRMILPTHPAYAVLLLRCVRPRRHLQQVAQQAPKPVFGPRQQG